MTAGRIADAPDAPPDFIGVREQMPSPVTQFFEGGRVSQTLDRVSKTLFDST